MTQWAVPISVTVEENPQSTAEPVQNSEVERTTPLFDPQNNLVFGLIAVGVLGYFLMRS